MSKTLEEYPELIKEFHPTKNGSAKPNEFTPKSGKKVWWLCSKGHEWETSISHRTYSKSNCPVCYRTTKNPNKKSGK